MGPHLSQPVPRAHPCLAEERRAFRGTRRGDDVGLGSESGWLSEDKGRLPSSSLEMRKYRADTLIPELTEQE